MSVISYNTVTLPYSYHTEFRQEAVYDEQGQTDWYLMKFDITVQCVINADYMNAMAASLTGVTSDAADIMSAIRAKLLKPRRTLTVTCNGKSLIPGKGGGVAGSVDAANGPKPQSCVCTMLTNSTFLMTYHIIAHYWENANTDVTTGATSNKAGSNVLYNRWTEYVDIDANNYTTRVRDGKFVIRSDNSEGVIADQVRTQMAVLKVPPGFLRKVARYTVDPSGLGIAYHIEDYEVFKKPPKPAFTAEGNYTESTTNGGFKRHGRVRLKLTGSKDTKQNELVRTAIAVAAAKLNIRRAAGDNKRGFTLLESTVIDVDMYQNSVEVIMQALMEPIPSKTDNKGRRDGMAAISYNNNALTTTPFSDGVDYTPKYLDRGSAGLLIQAAAYYDPNLVSAALQPSGQMNTGLQVGQAGKSVEG